MPPGFRSDETSAMVMGGMANMQGQAAFAQAITPQNFGAPIQPMTAPQPTQSPFASAANTAQQIWGGYGAVTGQMPGSMGQQQALDQLQMMALGGVVSPSTPVLGQVFGGMQQQAMLNRTLEQNFQFVRPGGRGFTGTQQLAIGAGMQNLAAQTPFVGMGELTQLMGQGAQLGQYQGLQDATAVIKRTRELMTQWRDIAVELNTTMSEAQQIMGQVKQLGVFRPGQQKQMIQGMATTAAMTGIGIQQQMQMGAMGAQIAPRAFGQGVGVRQAGAAAMQSQLQMVGVAARAGVLTEEQIFEATGQSGAQGRMALAQSLNMGSARFMRRGRGKVTMAAFVDPDTMQIDDDMVQRFMSGNMGLGEIERRARQNASKMGYVRWKANRGRLAAAFTEETAGLGHLALMRSFLGEGVMADTERSRLILAKQTGMSQSEIDAVMPMLRELPMLQNRMRNETRMVAKQREQAQRWNQYGPQAQMEKQKDKLRQAILGPIDNLRQGMSQAFMQAFEDAIEDAAGANEQAVSAASRELMGTMIRGGPGAAQARARFERAQGLTQADIQAFQGGTAAIQTDRLYGEAMRGYQAGGLRGGAAALLGGIKQRGVRGMWAGMGRGLREGGTGLSSKLGALLAGQSVEEMQAGMPMAGTDVLTKAYNTGVFGPEAMAELKKKGLSQDAFDKYTGVESDKVAQAILMGDDYADKLQRVKDATGVKDDEAARAIMAKVSKTKDHLAAIDFISPSGKSAGMNRTMQNAMKSYIAAGTGGEYGKYQSEIEANASSWIVDAKLQKMVAEGASVSEIMGRAETIGGKAAASFMQQQLQERTIKDPKTGKMRKMTEEEARERFKVAGDVQVRRDTDELIQGAYMSSAEDIMAAAGKGGKLEAALREARVGKGATKATKRQAGMLESLADVYKSYDIEGGVEGKDMKSFMDEVEAINAQILSQKPGDVDATIAMMRRAGMGAAANQLEHAAGIQRDIRKGTKAQARAKGARFLLGRQAAGFEDLLSKKGMTQEERYDQIAERMEGMKDAEGKPLFEADAVDQIRDLSGKSKQEIDEMVAKQASKLALFEEQQNKEAAAEKEEMKTLKKESMQATKDMKQDVADIATAYRAPKSLKDKIKIEIIGKDPQEKTNADAAGEGGGT